MNEFIVWYSNDINKDKFSKEFTLQELISQDHCDYISDSPLLVNYKVDSINIPDTEIATPVINCEEQSNG